MMKPVGLNKKYVAWLKLLSGIVLIAGFLFSAQKLPKMAILETVIKYDIDVGALFYTESEDAVTKSYHLQKKCKSSD